MSAKVNAASARHKARDKTRAHRESGALTPSRSLSVSTGMPSAAAASASTSALRPCCSCWLSLVSRWIQRLVIREIVGYG